MSRERRVGLLVGLLAVWLGACSAVDDDEGASRGPASGGGDGQLGSAGAGGTFSDDTPEPVGTLTGTVLAPQGTIPVAGAVVYLTPGVPAAIPDGLYCDRCVALAAGTPWTLSKDNGTFALPTALTGELYLVVQKGQFRRVRKLTVAEGTRAVGRDLTTFPKKTDKAAGDDVPRMAVLVGAWDRIEVTLAKLGLGRLQPAALPVLPPTVADASFDLLSDSRQAFLSDWNRLSRYHVVFLPCSDSDGATCHTWSAADDPKVRANLKRFVEEGGKLYVTDYSYEFVRRPFDGLVTWRQETSSTGSACLGEWSAPARVNDPGLRAWLAAQNITSFDVVGNWTAVSGLHTRQLPDAEGNLVDETPFSWVSANGGPATVSFRDGCGRVLFSTYHTEGDQGDLVNLLPQERALLYILLEVGVCVSRESPH